MFVKPLAVACQQDRSVLLSRSLRLPGRAEFTMCDCGTESVYGLCENFQHLVHDYELVRRRYTYAAGVYNGWAGPQSAKSKV